MNFLRNGLYYNRGVYKSRCLSLTEWRIILTDICYQRIEYPTDDKTIINLKRVLKQLNTKYKDDRKRELYDVTVDEIIQEELIPKETI